MYIQIYEEVTKYNINIYHKKESAIIKIIDTAEFFITKIFNIIINIYKFNLNLTKIFRRFQI